MNKANLIFDGRSYKAPQVEQHNADGLADRIDESGFQGLRFYWPRDAEPCLMNVTTHPPKVRSYWVYERSNVLA